MSVPERAVAAAQEHDRATRPAGDWHRVPDAQALRLLEGAAPLIRAEERERIRQLAGNHEARRACLECGSYGVVIDGPCCPESFAFADLLREQP